MSKQVQASNRRRRARAAAWTAAAVIAAMMPLETASAQGILDFLFGGLRRAPAPHAYAPSHPGLPSAGISRGDTPGAPITQVPSGDTGRRVAFCVRTCDGRYFPLQRVAGSSPAEVCRSFCPAAETKVFNGSLIDHAVASDGTRYSNLKTAFLYRTKLVSDCTCNGKTPLGIARIDPKEDPTLRTGDIVATAEGLQVYSGSRRGPGFTPVAEYSGLSKSVREQLADVKITPAPANAVTGPTPLPGDEASAGRRETTGLAARAEHRAQSAR